MRDFTGMNILKKLKNLSSYHEIHLQWIPSYVDISGNEAADHLPKTGAREATVSLMSLTFSELSSITKLKNKSTVSTIVISLVAVIKCSSTQALPDNILDCLGLSKILHTDLFSV